VGSPDLQSSSAAQPVHFSNVVIDKAKRDRREKGDRAFFVLCERDILLCPSRDAFVMTTDIKNCEPISPFHHAVPSRFKSVDERDDEFLELFPHRGSYLWAEHTSYDDRPQWRTENRHLLSDRLINQGAYLYGVRFGSKTNYLVVDVDRNSLYHPYRDPFAIGRIVASLEPLELYSYIAVSSSYSGGIHLYFPFVLGQPCWAIAQAVSCLMENAGFKIKPGQIELFPNARQYSEVRADYNGHRLPLQVGSYILDEDWQPIWSDCPSFVRAWRSAMAANHISSEAIHTVLKQADRRASRRIRGNAGKFLSDLNAEIEMGWTGYGQTNRLLGRIAMREYIFHHALHGGEPLTGDRLASEILSIAEALPGFEVWCRHQHELVRLCRNWAREVEAEPRYFPYDRRHKPESLEEQPMKQDANQRSLLRRAIASLRPSIASLLLLTSRWNTRAHDGLKSCWRWYDRPHQKP
jgi:hypothetical protein